MVHGRFQPFHNEHLSYVLEGLKRSQQLLLVGITNPLPLTHPEGGFDGDGHRHNADANPYSFLQRAQMVQLSLAEEAVDLSRVLVVPFHLDLLDRYAGFSDGVEQLVNVIDEWDEEKCARFAAAGFSVTRFHRPRTMSASQVRERISSGSSVAGLVPRGTLTVLAGNLA
jgi:nicotinamide-nucleotide adenylyltransferase